MANSNLFCEINREIPEYEKLTNRLESFGKEKNLEIYLLKFPKSDLDSQIMENDRCFILMIPNHKICLVNNGFECFGDYIEDVNDRLSYLFSKYNYREYFSRYKSWSKNLIATKQFEELFDLDSFEESIVLNNSQEKKNSKLLIALAIGSINDISRVKAVVPSTLLDKVKQKIQLFDADQTRFIYEQMSSKVIRIQGLSGTGKTELLLHKLRELYIQKEKYKIFFTCHNKVLADSLAARIPAFFDFMKVQEQIAWNTRLWCTNAWGRAYKPESGLYSYICNFYNIPFRSFDTLTDSFNRVCQEAVNLLKEKKDKENGLEAAFDYILVDESQDFKDSFIDLCSLVTRHKVYVAGDIFQSIFSDFKEQKFEADYYLNKCYRTDPKTLLFANALGFGLFEAKRYNWLNQQAWEACGFIYNEEDNRIILSRKPMSRFDETIDYNSIVINRFNKNEGYEAVNKAIIDTIYSIKSQNPTIEPDDICIIFLDKLQYIYDCSNRLEGLVYEKYGWKVNKTYETKEKRKGELAISNRNNVKGLEFPFVICVTIALQDDYIYRNVIYTMLTRSFITSYLIVSEQDERINRIIETGLKEIQETGKMTIRKATQEEQNEIGTRLIQNNKHKTLMEIVADQIRNLGVGRSAEERIYKIIGNVDLADKTEDEIREIINKLNDIVK